MHRTASLVAICLLLAVSNASKTSNQHFNLGTSIDELAKRFELAPIGNRDVLSADAALQSAMKGERFSIRILPAPQFLRFG